MCEPNKPERKPLHFNDNFVAKYLCAKHCSSPEEYGSEQKTQKPVFAWHLHSIGGDTSNKQSK